MAGLQGKGAVAAPATAQEGEEEASSDKDVKGLPSLTSKPKKKAAAT